MHKLKRSLQALTSYLILAMILSSCVQTGTTETPMPTFSFSPAQTATVTLVPTEAATAIPTSEAIAPIAGEQVYVDPAGQYAIKYPTEWKATDKPGFFAGDGGFFETGYLPEMGFVSRGLNVCVWLANTNVEQEQKSVGLGDNYRACSVESTISGSLEIYENPWADYEHRYIYLRRRWTGLIPVTFWWLKPIYEKEVEFSAMTLRPEDESFWASVPAMPPEFSVAEIALPVDADPADADLLRFVPPEALPTQRESMISNPTATPTVSEQLRSLGYELKTFQDSQGIQYQQLYRDGRILFDYVSYVSDVYRYPGDSAPITAFTIETRNHPSYFDVDRYVIQNDAINKLSHNLNDPSFPPVFHQGELLWVHAAENAHVEVQKSNREILVSFATYFGTRLPVNRFQAWNGHWILEIGDFVIQDGEIVNETFGFEEVFYWRLLNDKPIYLFRKGPRMGLSYDGQFFSLNYEDIARGYCCGLTGNNPVVFDNTLRFFGNRDGVWYYVRLEVNP